MDSITERDFNYTGMNLQSVPAASEETGKMNGFSVTVRNKLQKLFQPTHDGVKRFFKNNLKDIAITSLSASFVPAMKSLWLDTILTTRTFSFLHGLAKSSDQLMKPALSSLGLLKHVHIDNFTPWGGGAGYSAPGFFTRLPFMWHAFYPNPAEVPRAIIGFCTDQLQVLSTSLFSAGVSGIIEGFAQAKKINNLLYLTGNHCEKDIETDYKISCIHDKIEAYKILSNQPMISGSDLASCGISALLGSAIAGPVLGATAAAASLGAKVAVRGAVKVCAHWEVRSLRAQMEKLQLEEKNSGLNEQGNNMLQLEESNNQLIEQAKKIKQLEETNSKLNEQVKNMKNMIYCPIDTEDENANMF